MHRNTCCVHISYITNMSLINTKNRLFKLFQDSDMEKQIHNNGFLLSSLKKSNHHYSNKLSDAHMPKRFQSIFSSFFLRFSIRGY